MKARSGGYLGGLGANRSLTSLIALVVILFVAMVASILYTIRQNGLDELAVGRVNQERILAQGLAIESLEAANGKADAMAQCGFQDGFTVFNRKTVTAGANLDMKGHAVFQ